MNGGIQLLRLAHRAGQMDTAGPSTIGQRGSGWITGPVQHRPECRRNVVSPPLARAKSTTAPSVYLFCEKTTGTAHFQVEAGPDGELPVDHAAGRLAMQCMVRGQCPR